MQPVTAGNLADLSGIRHGFFTREGGVSPGPWASLNCGGVGDAAENIARNRAIACRMLGAGPDRLRLVRQVHGTRTLRAEELPANRSAAADALVSDRAGMVVGVLTADCAPVLLADGDARVVAALHAGWRGALGGIVESAVAAMVAAGAVRHRIRAAVGPTISAAAYEVGEDYRARFVGEDADSAVWFRGGAGGRKLRFDLPGYVLFRLARSGVADVESVGCCTFGEEGRYFSHRRSTRRGEKDSGRLLSAILLH